MPELDSRAEVKALAVALAAKGACEESIHDVERFDSLEELYKGWNKVGPAFWYFAAAKNKKQTFAITRTAVLYFLRATRAHLLLRECKDLDLGEIGLRLDLEPLKGASELVADIQNLAESQETPNKNYAQWTAEDIVGTTSGRVIPNRRTYLLKLVRKELPLRQFLISARRMIREYKAKQADQATASAERSASRTYLVDDPCD